MVKKESRKGSRSLSRVYNQALQNNRQFGILVVGRLAAQKLSLESAALCAGITADRLRSLLRERPVLMQDMPEILRKLAAFLNEEPVRLYALYYYNVDEHTYAQLMYLCDIILSLPQESDRIIAMKLLETLKGNPATTVPVPVPPTLDAVLALLRGGSEHAEVRVRIPDKGIDTRDIASMAIAEYREGKVLLELRVQFHPVGEHVSTYGQVLVDITLPVSSHWG